MNKQAFPFLASGIGLVLALLLARSTQGVEEGQYLLPPLTLLFISEFGFLVTVVGAWFGGRLWLTKRNLKGVLLAALGCLALALGFLYKGLSLWHEIALS
jgi:hypothetical protein